MDEITLYANAKVNLSLDITGVRPSDGYHLMDMVNCSASLSDEVVIRRAASGGLTVRSSAKYVPDNEKNLAYKAAAVLADCLGLALPPLEISVKKRIPTQAGLGGGSADAAAVLVGLNELLGLGQSPAQLAHIGESVGADVPFCVVGGAARVRGIGERIEPFHVGCELPLLILMPKHGRSTKEAFAAFDRGDLTSHPRTEALIAALQAGDAAGAAMCFENAFSSMHKSETTMELEQKLLRGGALGASMSGSGAAVFGLFSDRLAATRCRDRLKAQGGNLSVFLADLCESGVTVAARR